MDSIRPPSLGEIIAEQLRQDIVQRRLDPGVELHQEELARRFGTSRIPVRDALKALYRDGLVVSLANRRSIVAEIDAKQIRDHYNVRSVIEGEAARLCCQMSPVLDDLIAIQLLLDSFAKTGDIRSFSAKNHDFHGWIWHACNNQVLSRTAENLWEGIAPQTPGVVPSQSHYSVKEHWIIIQSLRGGDGERARDAMSSHVMSSCDRLLDFRGS